MSAAANVTTAFIRWRSKSRCPIRLARLRIFSDARSNPVARNGSDRHCRVDGWVAEKVQTQLGLLAVSVEQRTVDLVGLARQRVCANRAATLSCIYKCQGSTEEHEPGG